jgi:hypothetical protein
MTMAEDVQEDTTEDVAPDTVLEDAGTDKAAVVKDAVTEDKAATKETKTLLSDDEGDGSDKVSTEDYVYTPPEGSELSEEAQSRIDAFKDTAAEMKLNPEQFQSLIDFDVQRSKDALLQQANAYIERIEGWGGADQGRQRVRRREACSKPRGNQGGYRRVCRRQLQGSHRCAVRRQP